MSSSQESTPSESLSASAQIILGQALSMNGARPIVSSGGATNSEREASTAHQSSASKETTDADERWDAMLQGLIEFQSKYDSLNVRRYYRHTGRNLYEWCRNQRKHYLNGLRGKTPSLRPDRLERLKAICFEFDPTGTLGDNDAFDDKRWLSMFDGLVEFHRQHGTSAVPIGYLCDGRSLHDWIRHQRKLYAHAVEGKRPALSGARIDRLQSIGFALKQHQKSLRNETTEHENWEAMFRGLLLYKKQHGTFDVTKGTMYEGKCLVSWLQNQSRLYMNHLQKLKPCLLPERVKLFQSIDFHPEKRSPQHHKDKRKAQQSPETEGVSTKKQSKVSTGKSAFISAPFSHNSETSHDRKFELPPLVQQVLSNYQDMTLLERQQCIRPRGERD